MLSAIRISGLRVPLSRGFATTRSTAYDLARLTLIGRLIRDPEIRLTKNEKEYCVYTVATTNPRGLPNADGERPPSTSSFHKIISFSELANKHLRTLNKGSKVFVEAGFELREPDADADPSTYLGQRQIFLRHENIQVIMPPKSQKPSEGTENDYNTGF